MQATAGGGTSTWNSLVGVRWRCPGFRTCRAGARALAVSRRAATAGRGGVWGERGEGVCGSFAGGGGAPGGAKLPHATPRAVVAGGARLACEDARTLILPAHRLPCSRLQTCIVRCAPPRSRAMLRARAARACAAERECQRVGVTRTPSHLHQRGDEHALLRAAAAVGACAAASALAGRNAGPCVAACRGLPAGAGGVSNRRGLLRART